MYRPHAVWGLAALLLLGCQGQRGAYDPFGRTTIPPPGTGAVGQPGAPLYAPGAVTPPANYTGAPMYPPTAPAAPLQAPPAAPGFAPMPGTLTPAPVMPPTGAPAALPRVISPSPPYGTTSSWSAPGTAPIATTSLTTPNTGARLQPMTQFSPSGTPLMAAAPIAPQPAVAPIAANNSAAPLVVMGKTASGEPVVRIEEMSRPAGATPTVANSTPTSANPASRTTDLANLPAADHSVLVNPTSATITPASSVSGSPTPVTVTPASLEEKSGTATFRAANIGTSAPTATASRFAFAQDYSTLTGRLEYSAARQQWKLRYIPADAPDPQIDQYGGSVALKSTPSLEQYHDGDFVTVQGSLGKRDPAAKDFAPSYEISQIRRVE